MYKKCILFLLVGLVAGASSMNAGIWSKRETDPSEFSSSAYKGVSSSPSNQQNQDISTPLNASEIDSDNAFLDKIYKRKEKYLNRLLQVHMAAKRLATNAGRQSRRETDPSVVPSPAYEGVSSSPFDRQNEDSSTNTNASEIESDNGELEILSQREECVNRFKVCLAAGASLANGGESSSTPNKQSQGSTGRRSRRETDPSVVPSSAYEGVTSSPFNGQNQNSSTPLNASKIKSDNGLLKKIYKRKDCLIRLKVCLAVDASLANGGESSSTPNKQSQGSSSLSNGQSQDYTESVTSISNANENVSDNGLLNEIMKVKELLRNALDKYDEVKNTRIRELELSLKDILFYKNKIDKYIIQQNKRAEELEKQLL